MLELPPTIRTVREDEIAITDAILQQIELSKSANLIEGFTFNDNVGRDSIYSFFCEINVDNSNLWEVFKSLLLSYSEEVSLLFGHIDFDTNYGIYVDKLKILNELEPFKLELTQDGFLEFGVIYQDESKLKEIYVKKTKYIQFWGTDKTEFLKIMTKHSIFQVDDLNFIDEYPLVTESLRTHYSQVLETDILIEKLKNIFCDI